MSNIGFEKYTQIYDGGAKGTSLRPKGRAESFSFEAEVKENTRYRLFTVGETNMFYQWKDEPDYPQYYRMYTDALDSDHAIRDRYCVNMTCKKYETYLKRLYKKIPWKPVLSYLKMTPVPEEWETGITVTAKNLKLDKGGFLRMRVDIRLKKEGVDPRSIAAPADKTVIIDIPEGSYVGQKLSAKLTIPLNAAHVGVFIEGKGYKGECYIEQPRLAAIGQNLLPSFDESTPGKPQFEWAAQYMSRKEWPEFRVRLNGKVIHTGEIFERCHRYSEWELALPKNLLAEKNTVTYELISDYHDALPYNIYEIGVIEQKAGELAIIATDNAAPAGGKARVLVRTEKTNMRVTFKSLDGKLSGKSEWFFREKGLHGMLLDCGEAAENARFTLEWESGSAEGRVERIVVRDLDKVVTGTGDMIYINQNMTDMEEYLSWYLSNHVGDFITIRPAYRWAGTRTLNVDMWKQFRRLMRELDLKYVLMRDGREVEGLSTQPDGELLKGKNFYGIQMHEEDNLHYYGGMYSVINNIYSEMTHDLFRFAYLEDPAHTSSRNKPVDRYDYIDGKKIGRGFYRSYDWSWQKVREESVASLAAGRRAEDVRHTGPSSMFKYLAEAGYGWLGAETMYNTMEPLMGFLRGVAKEYSMPTYGVHHAVQWSTTPHDSPARFRRYRLALYASYLLGATDINTEEGLWHMEEYYEHHHRFGKACAGHIKQQQDFYKFVSTHTRSGEIYNPVAFVHGRDDGTTFFGKDRTWGRRGDPQTAAEDSWDLLKCVYPASRPVERMYIHNCPEDQPIGYHTGTPYGNLDAVPAEGKLSTFKDYRAMIFLAYNRMTGDDAKRFMSYVRQGGRLLLTRAHLTVTDKIEKIRAGELDFENNAMSFCNGDPVLAETTVNGEKLSVCRNAKRPDDVLAYTDDGQPLVCVYKYGKGEVVLFNTKAYPAEAAIRSFYEREMTRLIKEENAKESVWAEGADNVEFAVYNQKDGSRHVYFLATDWFRAPETERKASLVVGENKYDVTMPFGVMIKAVSDGCAAAWAESEDGEVMSVKDGTVTVQGTGRVSFCLARNGIVTKVEIDFSSTPIRTLAL